MSIDQYFPFWQQLTPAQQQALRAAPSCTVPKGTVLHNGAEDCIGLLVIQQGQLRAYMLSEDGREITLYRLFDRDLCLFSASCMMRSIEFDITIESERDTVYYQIPANVYQRLMQQSAPVANYTNEVMAARFSDVMWLLDQILYKRLDSRLAAFLLEESALDGGGTLRLTHEAIARHLGSAREVVTRMLRYFQQEGLVSLGRGGLTLLDREKLNRIAAASLR